MNAALMQTTHIRYATAAIDGQQVSIEQIRKWVNLLMLFSMLLSITSPLYAPQSSTRCV